MQSGEGELELQGAASCLKLVRKRRGITGMHGRVRRHARQSSHAAVACCASVGFLLLRATEAPRRQQQSAAPHVESFNKMLDNLIYLRGLFTH